MNKNKIKMVDKTNFFSYVSLIIGTVIAIVSEQYRYTVLFLVLIFIAIDFLSSLYGRTDKNTEEIKRLNEKLKIHEQLTTIKADIKYLQDINRKKKGKKNE